VAQPVTIVQPLSEVYGTPEWLRATTNVVGNMLASAERDCSLVAEHAPELRRYCADHGLAWDSFVAEHLETRTDFVEYVERGVEVLRAAGREGPIPTGEAHEAGQLASHGRPAANSAAEHLASQNDGTKGNHGNHCAIRDGTKGNHGNHSAIRGNRTAYLTARLEREADPERAEDPGKTERARELLEAIRDGAKTPNAAAVEMGWRKKKPVVQLDEHPDKAAARLVERFGAEWCRDLVIALDAVVQQEGE
jgi:hypothetical protein